MDQQDDSDLTNLNWVSGTEAPMNYSLSPPSSTRDNHDDERERGPTIYVDSYGHKKPMCSYSCLIAIALKAATVTESGACLPVQQIYNYIEELFPFYKNVSDVYCSWKNSIRQNLSLNQCFRKTLCEDGWEGKRGYFWEINPEHMRNLNREVERFLEAENYSLNTMRATLLRKYAKSSQRLNTGNTPKRTNTPRKEANIEVDVEAVQDPYEIAIYSPKIQKQLKNLKTPINAKTDKTNKVFDTNNPPSEFAGVYTPQTDDIGAAKELFSCGSTSETNSSTPLYKSTNHGDIIPFSTTPVYGIVGGYPSVGYGYGIPSPIMGMSPGSSGQVTPCVTPPFVPVMPVNIFAPYFVDPNGQPRPIFTSPPCQKCGHQNNPILPNQMQQESEDPIGEERDTKRTKSNMATTPTKKPRTYTKKSKIKDSINIPNQSPAKTTRPKGQPKKNKNALSQSKGSHIETEIDTAYSSEILSLHASSNDKSMGLQTPCSEFGRLNETIYEAGQIVKKKSSLKPSSHVATPDVDIQPFKACPVLECITLEEDSSDGQDCNSDKIRIIPELDSLLHLGDASISGIKDAMNMNLTCQPKHYN